MLTTLRFICMYCVYACCVQGACIEPDNTTDLLDSLDLSLSQSQLINLKLNGSGKQHHKHSSTTTVLRESQDDAGWKNSNNLNTRSISQRDSDVSIHKQAQFSKVQQQQLPAVVATAAAAPKHFVTGTYSQQLVARKKVLYTLLLYPVYWYLTNAYVWRLSDHKHTST
jgi:hypothetical protein